MHDDCYFYLYSECKLKERCRYRHNPLSKDNLILCKIWSKNKKCRLDCPMRHSLYHVVKQRSDTMCYWEDKGGCTKYRCEFRHVDSKKDEWKEPKVKLLTEIIESKNLHNSVISVSDVSIEDKSDLTVSDVNFIEESTEVKKRGSDLTVSDVNLVENHRSISDKEISTRPREFLNIKKHTNHDNLPDKLPDDLQNSLNEVKESVKDDNKKELLDTKTLLYSSKEDLRLHSKRELVNSEEKPSKKSKAETGSLDFDIDSLDKEIAELEKLLNDS
jgi:hypothetical protein